MAKPGHAATFTSLASQITEKRAMAGQWRASDRAVLANTGWRCSVFWFAAGRWWPGGVVFGGHKTAEDARAAAQAEAERRNAEPMTVIVQGSHAMAIDEAERVQDGEG